jgi:hypothetical protein
MLGCRTGSGPAMPAGRGGNNHARGRFATAALLLAYMSLGLPLGLLAWHPAAAQDLAAPDSAAMPAPSGLLNLTQRGIPAEATAENGVLARDRALASGRRIAWDRLVAEVGASPINLSDSQIENLVSSIVIEQERTSPTRYTGRITVNFSQSRVRSALGSRLPGLAGTVAPGEAAVSAPAPASPASNWLEVVATYHSMGEWLELRRRLSGAGPVASVEIQALAVDAARLRLGLRAPPPIAAGELGALGIALMPTAGPGLGPGFGESWRLGLAGGG